MLETLITAVAAVMKRGAEDGAPEQEAQLKKMAVEGAEVGGAHERAWWIARMSQCAPGAANCVPPPAAAASARRRAPSLLPLSCLLAAAG